MRKENHRSKINNDFLKQLLIKNNGLLLTNGLQIGIQRPEFKYFIFKIKTKRKARGLKDR